MKNIALTPVDGKVLGDKADIYAGPWCKKLKCFNNKKVPPIRFSEREKKEYFKKEKEVYNKVIKIVSNRLNKVHEKSKSIRYWKIIVDFAIKHQIRYLLQRYMLIEKLMDEYVSPRVVLLNESVFETINDWKEFRRKSILNDRYNLQLFSQASKFMKIKVKSRISTKKGCINLKNKAKNLYNRFLCSPGGTDASVSVCEYGVSNTKNVSKYSSEKIKQFSPDTYKVNRRKNKKKRSIIGKSEDHNGFLKCFIESLKWNIPQIAVEHYENSLGVVKNSIKKTPKLVIQKQPRGNPVTRVWVAECVERGAELAAVQHGANYGEAKHSWSEEMEKNTADTFFTWGWSHDEEDVPSPSSKLSQLNSMKRNKYSKKDEVLWLSKDYRFFNTNRYPLKKPSSVTEEVKTHIVKCQKFLQLLDGKIKDKITMRPKPKFLDMYDNVKDAKKDIRKKVGNISVDLGDKSFKKIMMEYSVIVIDHFPSTSFLQCIYKSVPVIAFGVPPDSFFRGIAKKEVKKMKEVGILNQEPKHASDKLHHIYKKGSKKWWKKKEVKSAVNSYKNKFTKKYANHPRKWAKTIDKLVLK